MLIFYLLASGIFYLPALLLLGAVAALGDRRRWQRVSAWGGLILGLLLVTLSAIPRPVALDVAGGMALLFWMVTRLPGRRIGRLRSYGRVALALVVVAGFVSELRWWPKPHVALPQGMTVHVVGDSLSAGVGAPGDVPWPQMLAREHGLTVFNHAVAGATTRLASRQVAALRDDSGLVLVLIGGNDLIGGRTADQFERDLDALLTQLKGAGHRVVMFELPLPPFQGAYGAVQRRLATRLDIPLVPRRTLGLVLAHPDSTVDGLHLSAAGHARLADAVWSVLRRD